MLPLAVLVFVVGTLVIANAWAVVDTKMAVTGAAREAVRSYVEAPDLSAAQSSAVRAATAAMQAAGRAGQLDGVDVRGALRRCERVEATVRATVPALRLPWVGAIGSFAPSSTASEVVDPLRAGLSGEANCVSG